jgi:hypothetical protein
MNKERKTHTPVYFERTTILGIVSIVDKNYVDIIPKIDKQTVSKSNYIKNYGWLVLSLEEDEFQHGLLPSLL